jgi:hypothetical protein
VTALSINPTDSRDHIVHATRERSRVALITCDKLPELDADDRLLLAPLAALGISAEPVAWDDPAVDWSGYDLAVLRSPWDYAGRLAEFLDWTRLPRRLANPPDVVAWNTDKRYLAGLAAAGVPIVPTTWVDPAHPWTPSWAGSAPSVAGSAGPGPLVAGTAGSGPSVAGSAGPGPLVAGTSGSGPLVAGSGEIVIKPVVSSGSQDSGRYDLADAEHRRLAPAHVARLQAAGRAVMIQPYLSAVDTAGETALLFLRSPRTGELAYSHAIRKGPLLDGPDEGIEGLYKVEEITPRTPSEAELAAARQVLAALPYDTQDLLYARVDLIPGPDGAPLLIELELTEPSLFLGTAEGAVTRFAEAIAAASA